MMESCPPESFWPAPSTDVVQYTASCGTFTAGHPIYLYKIYAQIGAKTFLAFAKPYEQIVGNSVIISELPGDSHES
jgi:hypothetical protein